MVARDRLKLSLSHQCHQCQLVSISRWKFYHKPKGEYVEALALMRQSGGRAIMAPATLFTRPQSDRTDLRQNQTLDAHGPKTNNRRSMETGRKPRWVNH